MSSKNHCLRRGVTRVLLDFHRHRPSRGLLGIRSIRTPPLYIHYMIALYVRAAAATCPPRVVCRRRDSVVFWRWRGTVRFYFYKYRAACTPPFTNPGARTHSGENSGHANGGGDPRAFSGTRRRVLLRDSRRERKTKSKPYIGNTRSNAVTRRHTRFPGRCPPSARPA